MNKIFLLTILFWALFAQAQEYDPNVSLIVTETTKFSELNEIKNSLDTIDEELKIKHEELNTRSDKEVRSSLEQEIRSLEQEKMQYWQQFIELSTGIALVDRQIQVPVASRDVLKEMQELIAPIIDTLRRASERPRRIEKFKNDIFNLQQELGPREEALKKMRDLVLDVRFGAYKVQMEQTVRLLERETRELQIELSSKERQLKKEMGEKKSFMDEATDLFGSFIKNKGKNLFFFILTFTLIFWGALWSRERVFRLKIWENERFEFLSHPLKGLYGFFAFILALLGAVLCLYILHDWVLVTLFLILLAGVIWSLKHIFPRFIQEARLILNLGTVREGERILWNGVPWKIVKLGFQTLLKNENLQNGNMKIASKDLINLYSRPIVETEGWFPSKVGDWIFYGEQNLAQVKTQTAEQVILERQGGSLISIPLNDYLKMKFENLSCGFAVELVCTVDYKLQNEITNQVEAKLKEYFIGKISNQKGIKNFFLEYHSSGPRGLNFYICLDCEGELASERLKLERLLHRYFIEACNLNQYKIPLEQLAVRMEHI